MVTIQASSIDELNIIWRRLRKDFQVIESIHLHPKSLQYRMVVNRPELTSMLRSLAEKTIERVQLYDEAPLRGVMTVNQFHVRIEEQAHLYQSLEPIVKIWSLISPTDKKAVYAFLRNNLEPDAEDIDEEQVALLKD